MDGRGIKRKPPGQSQPSDTAATRLRGRKRADATPETQVLAPAELSILKAMGVDIDDPAATRVASMVLERTMSMSSSPYPSPDMLAEYENRFRPGFADKILATIDQQTAHRQGLEREMVQRAERRKDRGQVFAFSIAILSFVAAGLFHLIGVSGWVLVMGLVLGVGGPSTAMVLARKLDDRRGRE